MVSGTVKQSISTPVPGFAGPLPPERFNLSRYCLQNSTNRHPDKTALIICNDANDPNSAERWTFQQIEDVVLRLAAGLLTTGLRRGDRLFIRMGNSIDYALTFFAANAAGLVPVPASTQLSVREVALLVKDCGASAIAFDGTLPLPDLPADIVHLDLPQLNRLKITQPGRYCDTGKDDPAFLIYTSGTTSTPKGVLHAQRAVWGRRPMYRDWYDMSEDDRLLHTGAFNWTYTLGTGLFDQWANGATSIVYTGPKDITIWPRLIEIWHPTILAAVPSLYRQILKYCELSNHDLSSLRHCLTAGEPLPENIRKNWFDQTGLTLSEALGMSEISTYISTSPARASKRSSPGMPQTGRCVAILPETGGTTPLPHDHTGIIAIHTSDPGLMLGYWNRPDEEAAARRGDWFLTGDLAAMDEEGFIWFGGRNDDLMNAMGYRVSPVEVETILEQHPAIDHAGVCAITVGEDIEIIAAFLTPVEDHDIDIDDVSGFAVERLAA
ncbi:MAG TPA: acyl-CoA synthetase, partial [Rhizobiales bacterium]|nr:acyl-CoA synthetase [Hyphomicrobiales bacterium]